MEPISLLDYVLLPFVGGIVYAIAFRIRNKYYPAKHPWRKYFIAGLSVKIIGAVFNGMLHYYYYGGGDTFNFFHDSRIINASLNDSITTWVNLVLRLPSSFDVDYYRYTSEMYFYTDPPSYTVASIGAVLSLLTFGKYLPTAVLFAFLSYSGVWAMFRTFASLYPKYVKPIAVATLFIPTVGLWGSAIYKDTLCMFGLGWLTYGVFRFLVQRDFSLGNIFLAALSFLLIGVVKIYILIAFIPALGMWILFNYTKGIRERTVRRLVKIGTLVVLAFGSLTAMTVYSRQLGVYSLENIASKAEETRTWITYASETQDGSTYSLGDMDVSLQGMLLKFPQAVNVTLFRPFPWEARKVIMAFSAAESMIFLYLTLRVLWMVGLRRTWRTITQDPNVQFCLIFAVIFSFAVGVTTYNFGSLSRYKIPCLSYYVMAMILIFYHYQPSQKKLLPPFF